MPELRRCISEKMQSLPDVAILSFQSMTYKRFQAVEESEKRKQEIKKVSLCDWTVDLKPAATCLIVTLQAKSHKIVLLGNSLSQV